MQLPTCNINLLVIIVYYVCILLLLGSEHDMHVPPSVLSKPAINVSQYTSMGLVNIICCICRLVKVTNVAGKLQSIFSMLKIRIIANTVFV